MNDFFYNLALMVLGYVALVVFRAYLKAGSTQFDFWLWIKYDFARNMIGLILCLLFSAISILDSSAFNFIAGMVNASKVSPMFVGFAISGLAMLKSSDAPIK